MATVHLVDASPYIFRGYFSIPATVVGPDGSPKNAVHGFAGFLFRLLDEEKPTHVAVTFDESLSTSFRNEYFPAYKAQRVLPPKELEAQLKDCQELAAALGLATFVSHRYEADDIIATLLGAIEPDGHSAVIVTSDKDLTQLVTERVSVLDFGKGSRLGPAEVVAKMGVPPERVTDLMGLMGDSVDNIPGVPGIGPKTAVALLQAFGTLDALYERLDEVPWTKIRGAKGLAALLRTHRDQAMLSRRLAEVSRDAPTSATLDDLEWKGADRERLGAFCERLRAASLMGRVKRWR